MDYQQLETLAHEFPHQTVPDSPGIDGRSSVDDTQVDLGVGFDLPGHPDLRNLKYLTSTDHLNCPICRQPFLKPTTTLCGHTFCNDCIRECIKTSTETEQAVGFCPLDRTPIDANTDDLFPAPILINNLVDDLQVRCLNQPRGCTWNGCRWEVEHHLVADCQYTGIECGGIRNDNICKLLVERRFSSDNEDSMCVHSEYPCEYCTKTITKVTESDHLQNHCDDNFQVCDLCNNDMIPLKSLEAHKQACKLSKFICPASEIGCKFVGTTQPSLENHLANGCQLVNFLPYYQQLDTKINELSAENTFLQRQLNQILNLIIQGKITNLGYNEPLEEINKFKEFKDIDQDKLVYLTYELERLRHQVDDKLVPFVNKQTAERDPLINTLMNDNFMMKDDLNLQRILINSLRKQIQFILFKNHRHTFGMNLSFDEDLSDNDDKLNLKL